MIDWVIFSKESLYILYVTSRCHIQLPEKIFFFDLSADNLLLYFFRTSNRTQQKQHKNANASYKQFVSACFSCFSSWDFFISSQLDVEVVEMVLFAFSSSVWKTDIVGEWRGGKSFILERIICLLFCKTYSTGFAKETTLVLRLSFTGILWFLSARSTYDAKPLYNQIKGGRFYHSYLFYKSGKMNSPSSSGIKSLLIFCEELFLLIWTFSEGFQDQRRAWLIDVGYSLVIKWSNKIQTSV